MATLHQPDSVKLFAGILFVHDDLLERAAEMLASAFSPVDYRSEAFPFDVTDYYHAEMGSPIRRLFVSFRELIDPGELARVKVTTNRIEDELANAGKRQVNIDSGYMDFCKVVLASGKYNGQKIYVGQGIYADLTLYYEKGAFLPYPWSFPDFRKGRYNGAFLQIRARYKIQRRQAGD